MKSSLTVFISLLLMWLTVAHADNHMKLPAGYTHKVYELPEGSGPHDVAPAPDGLIWYTAQRQGALGILNPADGHVRQISLGKGSAPHGVIQGPDGQAWVTDSGLNAIVRYNPKTEKMDTWPLPEKTGYANLNTATFDHQGVHWFTGQAGIYGSLHPERGDMKIYDAPKGAGPYGIATTPAGQVFYASLAGSYVAEINTKSGVADVVGPPTENQGARRVWSDSKNRIWVSEWNSGQLSRYDMKSQKWRTWPLPGKNPRAYAVYVDERDKVWVSDFTANCTWLFDPDKNAFTGCLKGSGDNANVRQILGRPGEVWLPESGTDRLVRITWQG